MTFENEAGEVLDFDGDFAITKQAVSFFNSKIKGDFSVNFNVDNNSVNRKVLGYDGPMMLNQAAYTRQPFTLMRNGNPFAKGFIVIQSDKGDYLDCYFISGNSNWINLLNGLITELDYSGVTNAVNYEMQWTSANVYTAMSATSGIVFPMVDWCYGLNKGGNEWFVASLYDASIDVFKTYCEWYPCFYLHTLVQEIAKQNDIKITGNILDDKLYQTLVLSPTNGDIRREPINATTAIGSAQASLAGPAQKYTALVQASDPEGLFASASYTSNKTTKLIFTITIVSITGAGSGTSLQLYKNGSQAPFPFGFTVAPGQTGQFISVQQAASGDVYELYLDNVVLTGATVTVNLKIEIPTIVSAGDLIKPNEFLPSLSCLDIIKFIVSYFGCSTYYNEYSKTININIIEKIKEEDAPDWSEYFVRRKVDYNKASAANNYMRLLESEDTEIKAYDKAHLVKYGEGNITTGNTLKETNELLQIPFAASEFGFSKNESWISSIPLVNMEDSGDPIIYTSIINVGGRARFVYGPGSDLFTEGQAVRIVDDDNGDIGIFIVHAATTNQVDFFEIPFIATGTGKLYTQALTFNQITPRLLVVKPEVLISDFSYSDEYNLYDSTFTLSAKSSSAVAYFSKPSVDLTIDSMTANAAFNNPDIINFNSPTVQDLYFPKIGRMLGNPVIPVVMLLPESEYQSFEFDTFIYLKTEDLTGYFWVESINHYNDSNTEVVVNLLML